MPGVGLTSIARGAQVVTPAGYEPSRLTGMVVDVNVPIEKSAAIGAANVPWPEAPPRFLYDAHLPMRDFHVLRILITLRDHDQLASMLPQQDIRQGSCIVRVIELTPGIPALPRATGPDSPFWLFHATILDVKIGVDKKPVAYRCTLVKILEPVTGVPNLAWYADRILLGLVPAAADTDISR